MLQPPYLKTGDTIGIVAPASFIKENEIKHAMDLISSWGINIKLGKNLFKNTNSFAGTDSQRTKDFQEMLDKDEINAIICARGGYGSVRIIDKLNFDHFINHPKWIAGSSDITILHALLQNRLGIESLHSTMPRDFSSGRGNLTSVQTLKDALFGNLKTYKARSHPYNRPGEADGILVGGNLSVLYSLRGTKYDIDTRDKILFLEDVDEYLYHIDRMIINFTSSGKLQNLKGLIIGGMNNMKPSRSGFDKPAYDIIKEATVLFDYPIMFGAPSGHTKPNNTLIFGRYVNMRIDDKQCRLIF